MRTLALAAALVVSSVAPARAETVLKVATLAPEGSSWMKLFHKWADAVQQRTEGRVRIKIFGSAVQGDERDVLRKIRLGQLAGGAFTGIGLQAICPEVRTLEVARTDAELDALRASLGDKLKKRFDERGFFLGGWGDVGPIHLFTNVPVRSLDDLKKVKLWQWNEDPVSAKLYEALGIRGIPMGAPEVLPGLSTGQIDAFFGTPLSTVALQWSTHAKFMSAHTVGMATGATVFLKKALEALSPADRAVLAEEGEKMQAEVLALVRRDNKLALEALKKQGIQIVELPPALAAEFERRGEAVARAAGQNFPPEITAEVERIILGMRKPAK